MSFFKKLIGLSQDTVRWSIAPIQASGRSITGKNNFSIGDYKTGIGRKVGGTITKSNDITHNLGKTTANGISAGYATKATNSIRKEEYREGDGSLLIKGLVKDKPKQISKDNLVSTPPTVPLSKDLPKKETLKELLSKPSFIGFSLVLLALGVFVIIKKS